MTETGIEQHDDYKSKSEPYTWVDWVMLSLSALGICLAVYFWSVK